MPDSDAIRKICDDPKYFKEMPSCACIKTADTVNQGIQKVVDQHKKEIDRSLTIEAENKDKTKKLGIAVTEYTNQLRKTGFFTQCKLNQQTAKDVCKREGFDKTEKVQGSWSKEHAGLTGAPSVATGWKISHEVPNPNEDPCGMATESGIALWDSFTGAISSQNHAWCWYSEPKIDQMKALRQKVLAEEAQYKHIDPPSISGIDVSGLTTACCTNSIIVDGDNINVHDVTQKCKIEMNQKVRLDMRAKGLGTPDNPKPVTTANKLRNKLRDALRDKFHITIDETTTKGKVTIGMISLVVILVVILVVLLLNLLINSNGDNISSTVPGSL